MTFRAMIEPDARTATGITALREVEVPAELAAALAGDANARRIFDGPSYCTKRRIVMPIEEAKSAATRKRRIAKAAAAGGHELTPAASQEIDRKFVS